VYGVLVVIMLATAASTVLVFRRTRGGESGVRAQLESFGYLGAAALALVAAAVLVLGLAGVSGGRPEQLGMIGMFAFVLYLGIAYVVAHLLAHRR
jgi:hypothetical protein